MTNLPSGQLGFEAMLAAAETKNRTRAFERETGHLPGTIEEALPFYRVHTRQHHAAMLACNVDETMRLRKQAHLLALRLNGGDTGILAHPDAPGYVLARETAAAPGTVPLWGQTGSFVIAPRGMELRIEIEGLFGIGSGHSFWPGFAAHAVDRDRPFLSQTGYRSFLGIHADPEPGLLPDEFSHKVIESFVARQLKGKLVAIQKQYRNKAAP